MNIRDLTLHILYSCTEIPGQIMLPYLCSRWGVQAIHLPICQQYFLIINFLLMWSTYHGLLKVGHVLNQVWFMQMESDSAAGNTMFDWSMSVSDSQSKLFQFLSPCESVVVSFDWWHTGIVFQNATVVCLSTLSFPTTLFNMHHRSLYWYLAQMMTSSYIKTIMFGAGLCTQSLLVLWQRTW